MFSPVLQHKNREKSPGIYPGDFIMKFYCFSA